MIDPRITGPAQPEPQLTTGGFDPIDIVAAAGAGLVTVGVAFVWLPAAPIVLGALFLAYAINASRNEPPEVTP